jgi:hypothetical protein
MENKTHSFTHAKGLNIDPFKNFCSSTQIIIGLMTRASNLDKSILKPSLLRKGYKGGTSHFIHLIIFTQFDILPPFIYPCMAVQILLLFRGRNL